MAFENIWAYAITIFLLIIFLTVMLTQKDDLECLNIETDHHTQSECQSPGENIETISEKFPDIVGNTTNSNSGSIIINP